MRYFMAMTMRMSGRAIALALAGVLGIAAGANSPDNACFPHWYFNVFSAKDTAIGFTPVQANAARVDACHKAQEARDFVFSDPRS